MKSQIGGTIILFFCTLLFGEVRCLSIHFFEQRWPHPDQAPIYTHLGPIRDGQCYQVTQILNQTTIRVNTEICLLVFRDLNCTKSKKKVDSPGIIFHNKGVPKSYMKCDGTKLDFTMVGYNDQMPVDARVFETHTDVCSCVNVPERVHNMDKWYLYTLGNELLAYFEPDCLHDKFEPLLIDGGNTLESSQIYLVKPEGGFYQTVENRVNKILSLGPNPNSSYFQEGCVLSKQVMEQAKEILRLKESSDVLQDRLDSLTNTAAAKNEQMVNKVRKLEKFLSEKYQFMTSDTK